MKPNVENESPLNANDTPELPTLSEVHRSVPVSGTSWIRRLLSFAGAGLFGERGLYGSGQLGHRFSGRRQIWLRLAVGDFSFQFNGDVFCKRCACVWASPPDAIWRRRAAITTKNAWRLCCGFYAKLPSSPATWPKLSARRLALNLLFQIPLFWGVVNYRIRCADFIGCYE